MKQGASSPMALKRGPIQRSRVISEDSSDGKEDMFPSTTALGHLQDHGMPSKNTKAFSDSFGLPANAISSIKSAEADQNVESLFSKSDNSKGKNFKVVVRVRPMIDAEQNRGEFNTVTVFDHATIKVDIAEDLMSTRKFSSTGSSSRLLSAASAADGGGGGTSKTFSYDRVYEDADTQETVYTSAIKAVVDSTLEGYNGCIIAYGQTGTGKTHTIEGGGGSDRGVIPRASDDIMRYVNGATNDKCVFVVSVSFLQIYNEKILDLLEEKDESRWKPESLAPLECRERPSGDVYVEGLIERTVTSAEDIQALLERGAKNRTTASTRMNRASSRSHAVFSIRIERTEQVDGGISITVGNLHLVDLAGSERLKHTGIGATETKRLDEAKSINASLSAFGKVVLALTTGVQHVPYRDSKLTRILQGSLGGNCKTTMIVNIGPAASSGLETVSSLKFGTRAKKVKNYAVVNQDMTDKAMLSAYEKEIERLREELKRTRTQTQQMQMHFTDVDPNLTLKSSKHHHHQHHQPQRSTKFESIIKELEEKLRSTEGQLVLTQSELSEARKFKTTLLKKIGIMETMLLEEAATKIRPKTSASWEGSESELDMSETSTQKFDPKGVEQQLTNRYQGKLADIAKEQTQMENLKTDLLTQQHTLKNNINRLAVDRREFERIKADFEAEKLDFETFKSTALAETIMVAAASSIKRPDSPKLRSISPKLRSLASPTSIATPTPNSTASTPTQPHIPPTALLPTQTTTLGNGETTWAYAPDSPRAQREQPNLRQRMKQPRPSMFMTTKTSVSSLQSDDTVTSVIADDYEATPTPPSYTQTSTSTTSPNLTYDVYLQALKHPTKGIPTHSRRHNHHYYRNVFTGHDAALWFCNNLEGVDALEDAENIGKKFVNWGTIVPIDGVSTFHATPDKLYAFDDATSDPGSPIKAVNRSVRPQASIKVRTKSAESSASVRPIYTSHSAGSTSASDRDRPNTSTSSRTSLSDRPITSHTNTNTNTNIADQRLGTSTSLNMSESNRIPTASSPRRVSTDRTTLPSNANIGTGEQRRRSGSGSRMSLSSTLPLPQKSSSKDGESTTPSLAALATVHAGGRTGRRFSLEMGNRSSYRLLTRKNSGADLGNSRPSTRGSISDLDPSFTDCGATLLHSAAGQGDRTAMKTFFQTFPVDSVDNLGRTPLMYACCTNRLKAVELLIKQGCSCTVQDSDGRTALLWAAYYGHHDILRLLVKTDVTLPAHIGPDGRSGLHWASKHPSTKCLDILLKVAGQFVNLQDLEQHTALHWAILCQHHEHTLKLLKAGANPGLSDKQEHNALHYAVKNDSQLCLQVLLQNLESIDVINQPDEKKRTPLHLAITTTGPVNTVLLLLSLPGIDVNALDFRMTAPLHWAAVCGRVDICKALIARGATLNMRDSHGMTPLHYADDKGHVEVAQILQRLQNSRMIT